MAGSLGAYDIADEGGELRVDAVQLKAFIMSRCQLTKPVGYLRRRASNLSDLVKHFVGGVVRAVASVVAPRRAGCCGSIDLCWEWKHDT